MNNKSPSIYAHDSRKRRKGEIKVTIIRKTSLMTVWTSRNILGARETLREESHILVEHGFKVLCMLVHLLTSQYRLSISCIGYIWIIKPHQAPSQELFSLDQTTDEYKYKKSK